MRVQVKVKPVERILKAHGLNRDGYAQRYWTNIVNRRITRYMPYRSGTLADYSVVKELWRKRVAFM